jgi:hypothetical protein
MTMDEIERGFEALEERIHAASDEIPALGDRVREREGTLLSRMAVTAAEIVPVAGLEVLARGKMDGTGEMYDQVFYPDKMLIIGKTDPMPFRPDDPNKQVMDQFCVLRPDGTFAELMYSNDTVVIDSYLSPLSPEDALAIYGPELLFMLYRALRDYLAGQETLIAALGTTLEYLHG